LRVCARNAHAQARSDSFQTRVLARVLQGLVLLIGLSLMLMTFPAVRQIGASLLASAGVVDYRMPLAPLREALQRACEASEHWDRRFALLQVTEAGEQAMQLRCLVTSASAPAGWDLRCHVRESLLDFMQREYPQYLPRQRAELSRTSAP
jgi:hypothetical protein